MKTKLSCALGLALLAASFTLGSSFACSEATETTPSVLQAVAPDSEGAQISATEAQVADVDQSPSVAIEIEQSTDAPLTGDAIVVEITQTVTIVVPGQIIEDNDGPTHTGSIPEPSVILDPQTTALDDADF